MLLFEGNSGYGGNVRFQKSLCKKKHEKRQKRGGTEYRTDATPPPPQLLSTIAHYNRKSKLSTLLKQDYKNYKVIIVVLLYIYNYTFIVNVHTLYRIRYIAEQHIIVRRDAMNFALFIVLRFFENEQTEIHRDFQPLERKDFDASKNIGYLHTILVSRTIIEKVAGSIVATRGILTEILALQQSDCDSIHNKANTLLNRLNRSIESSTHETTRAQLLQTRGALLADLRAATEKAVEFEAQNQRILQDTIVQIILNSPKFYSGVTRVYNHQQLFY
ncbi:MAG: hypothetical protein EXX96DRAFT_538427 [Benjaminiella poitrasii]|nr:MAG: hypothetical protein EXX96DRAFT_538427 [Benjaminiella poitrasii]